MVAPLAEAAKLKALPAGGGTATAAVFKALIESAAVAADAVAYCGKAGIPAVCC